MKLNLKKRLVAKSGKVKSVDFQPTFSWILLGLYNGSISIYDYNTQTSVQYLEVTTFPIRCVKFMPEKNYIICGADDKKIRVYNYNTMEKVKEFEVLKDGFSMDNGLLSQTAKVKRNVIFEKYQDIINKMFKK